MTERKRCRSRSRIDRVVAQQVARAQLEILEVERGLALLRLRIGSPERRQELLEELAVACGEVLERGRHHRVARLGEPGRARPASPHLDEDEKPLGQGGRIEDVERSGCGPSLRLGRPRVVEEQPGRLPEGFEPLGQRRAQTRLEHELAARRAQRRVDLDEHLTEPHRAVRRQELPAVGLVGRAEALERRLERLRLEHERLGLVEHAERRVDPRRERVRAQHAAAEPVNGRHPGAVELEGEVGPPALDQPGPDPSPELARGALRVGDHEQRADVEPLVDDRADEALDEHRRLAGARAGGHEDGAGRLDRGALLLVRAAPSRTVLPAHAPEIAPVRALAALRVVPHVAAPDALDEPDRRGPAPRRPPRRTRRARGSRAR